MGGFTSKAPAPEPLSMEQILRVRARLESRKQLTPELKACFNLVLSEFRQELQCVQENARMTIQCGPTVLGFVSGLQENQIHTFHVEGQLQCNITTTCWGTVLARVCSKMTALVDSIPVDLLLENLRKISARDYGTQFPSTQQLSEIFQILRK